MLQGEPKQTPPDKPAPTVFLVAARLKPAAHLLFVQLGRSLERLQAAFSFLSAFFKELNDTRNILAVQCDGLLFVAMSLANANTPLLGDKDFRGSSGFNDSVSHCLLPSGTRTAQVSQSSCPRPIGVFLECGLGFLRC